ncbi:MAG: hypothetical protein ACM3XO_23000 [Bacteroidota bacterium]
MRQEINPLRVLGKALLLFIVINLLYGLVDPSLGGLSAYNIAFPGRVRFPFGSAEDPNVVMVDNLDVMTASHVISLPKQPDEYRVVLIGDSSVWGEKSSVSDTISEQWNALHLQCDGRKLKFYNLGYPHPSVVKDMIILDKAMEYQPDMIVWFVTLNTLIPKRLSPFIAANRERAAKVLTTYNIPLAAGDEEILQPPSFYDRTLLGKRSDLARALKLQVLGILWTASGQDKKVSIKSRFLSQDVEADPLYRGIEPGKNLSNKMMFNALAAGHAMAQSVPMLIVNEPIFIATGQNSDIRYNEAYPRWAFDQYRNALALRAQQSHWNYLDLWNAVPDNAFYDAGMHVTAEGERLLIGQIDPALQKIACP